MNRTVGLENVLFSFCFARQLRSKITRPGIQPFSRSNQLRSKITRPGIQPLSRSIKANFSLFVFRLVDLRCTSPGYTPHLDTHLTWIHTSPRYTPHLDTHLTWIHTSPGYTPHLDTHLTWIHTSPGYTWRG